MIVQNDQVPSRRLHTPARKCHQTRIIKHCSNENASLCTHQTSPCYLLEFAPMPCTIKASFPGLHSSNISESHISREHSTYGVIKRCPYRCKISRTSLVHVENFTANS